MRPKPFEKLGKGKKMRVEKLGLNITSNPFLVALSILDMICDLYLYNFHSLFPWLTSGLEHSNRFFIAGGIVCYENDVRSIAHVSDPTIALSYVREVFFGGITP